MPEKIKYIFLIINPISQDTSTKLDSLCPTVPTIPFYHAPGPVHIYLTLEAFEFLVSGPIWVYIAPWGLWKQIQSYKTHFPNENGFIGGKYCLLWDQRIMSVLQWLKSGNSYNLCSLPSVLLKQTNSSAQLFSAKSPSPRCQFLGCGQYEKCWDLHNCIV